MEDQLVIHMKVSNNRKLKPQMINYHKIRFASAHAHMKSRTEIGSYVPRFKLTAPFFY